MYVYVNVYGYVYVEWIDLNLHSLLFSGSESGEHECAQGTADRGGTGSVGGALGGQRQT